MKRIIPPYEGPPVSKKISRQDVVNFPRYVKTGDTFGRPKTFPDGLWDDSLNWNDQNIWEE